MARFIVVGAGAIGGVVGARLRSSGASVVFVARGVHGAAIAANGITVHDTTETQVVLVPVVEKIGELELGPDDIVLCAVKSQDTAEVVDALVAAGGIDVPLVLLQNGVANERTALRSVRRVYGCAVMSPTVFLEPGVVRAHGGKVTGLLDLGCFPSGVDKVAESVASAFNAAGFLSEPRADIMSIKYAKLLSNLTNAIEVVCGPEHRPGPLSDVVVDEGKQVLDAAGIAYATEADPRRKMIVPEPVGGTEREGGSTYQSVLRHAGSIETPYLNGEIVLEARLHGAAAPANEVIGQLAAEVAAGRRPLGGTSVDEVLDLIEQRRGGKT